MAKKEQLITGLDIGSHAVKICQLHKAGKSHKLVAAGATTLPSGAVEDGVLQDPEVVGNAISSLFKNLKIKNNKVGISISGYSVIVKKINLEYMTDDALEEYISMEAEQYIPFDISEVYLDYKTLPTSNPDEDRRDVMLVAAKKDVVDDYILMLQEQKLKPVLVDVDGFALENIWEYSVNQSKNVALVDIGASKMNINVISNGASVLARDIMVGCRQLTDQLVNALDIEESEAEKIKLGVTAPSDLETVEDIFSQTCTQWVLEIKKAIDLYQANNPDKPLNNLSLSGGGAMVNGLADYIRQETDLKVDILNPFETMAINSKKIDRQYLESIAPQMAIATGLAIRPAAF